MPPFWEAVARKLRSGQMPPLVGRGPIRRRASLRAGLEQSLDDAASRAESRDAR